MKVLLTKTKPELFFAFLETVASLQPCTIEQIRKHMKSKWGPVRSARNFASQYGFVSMQEKTKKFSLTTDGERLLRYTNNSRIDFLIFNFKLQDYEPFLSLQYELSLKTKMKISEIGDFLTQNFLTKKNGTQKKSLSMERHSPSGLFCYG